MASVYACIHTYRVWREVGVPYGIGSYDYKFEVKGVVLNWFDEQLA